MCLHGFGFAAFWLRKRLDKRLYYNELQQEEADTLLGDHGDGISNPQAEVMTLQKQPDTTDTPPRPSIRSGRMVTPTHAAGASDLELCQAQLMLWMVENKQKKTSGQMKKNSGQSAERQVENLLSNLRGPQNECLASENYEDAREFQRAIGAILEPRDPGAGLTSEVSCKVRSSFQRKGKEPWRRVAFSGLQNAT